MAFQPPPSQGRSPTHLPPPLPPPPPAYARTDSYTTYEDIKLSSPLLPPQSTTTYQHGQEPDLEKLSPGYQHKRGWRERCGVGMRCAAGVLGMAVFAGVIYFVSVKVWSDGQGREGE